jgi:hypothetical protein
MSSGSSSDGPRDGDSAGEGNVNDSDEIRTLLDGVAANQREIVASLSRLESGVAALETKLTNLETAVSHEVAGIRMMTAHRRHLLDSRCITSPSADVR